MTQEKHKYADMCERAYYWSSFNPDKAGARQVAYYEEICQRLRDAGKADAVEKFDRLFCKYISAVSRCASPAVTGPANFPVARMEKHRNWEQRAYEKMTGFIDAVFAPPKQPRTELDYGIQAGEKQYTHFKAVKNLEENRLQLVFDGKPEEEIRAILKKNGYKWSPRNSVWQRQLTPNAISNLRYVLDEVAKFKEPTTKE